MGRGNRRRSRASELGALGGRNKLAPPITVVQLPRFTEFAARLERAGIGASAFNDVMAELKAVGAVMHYSGGNDEGGFDGVTITFEDGHDELWSDDGDMTGMVGGDDAAAVTVRQELMDRLFASAAGEWGSFAGAPYVNGKITWSPSGGIKHDYKVEEFLFGAGGRPG